jgi:hypothetical protein
MGPGITGLRRFSIAAACLFGLAAAADARPPEPPARPATPPQLATDGQRQAFATAVCAEIDARAAEHALPGDFLVRLIWRESLFDPAAISPAGAQGIAQFMPGTASRRGLADPFDPLPALAASASYLSELRASFGNLGLAAAAYNAGEDRVRAWLAGTSGLPYETRDYVLAITGRTHDEWKQAEAAFAIPALGGMGTFVQKCEAIVLRQLSPEVALTASTGQRAAWKPWGVVVSGGFSEARALAAFRTIRGRYAFLAGEDPLVLRKRNLSMGRRKTVQVQIGRNSRAEALKLCQRITAAGGACMVEKN